MSTRLSETMTSLHEMKFVHLEDARIGIDGVINACECAERKHDSDEVQFQRQ
jgi:hypothetical protein